MIVRNVDGIVKIIGNIHDQDEFISLNPTGGFMKVDDLPFSRYGNYRLVDGDIVVDEAADAAELAVQYKIDRSYPSIGEQLDMLWHDIDANDDLKSSFNTFYTALKVVKDNTPKPE